MCCGQYQVALTGLLLLLSPIAGAASRHFTRAIQVDSIERACLLTHALSTLAGSRLSGSSLRRCASQIFFNVSADLLCAAHRQSSDSVLPAALRYQYFALISTHTSTS
ncbi:hypothetical protein IE81DRAFT_176270 [Ceraceosorus guamensis]|uniref:Secreted protein n=1 Tax=Ceraceosorus guamensis TaxID=1522189 RepID=A0A316VWY2_9BASI|nr:hypothetical protein IE81DRAFT_176270 [Ceraceosorus guamensis]PWN41428.1 hypothetical protein IE81DRAFT_176270 [Ceraceosorus guamensis]